MEAKPVEFITAHAVASLALLLASARIVARCHPEMRQEFDSMMETATAHTLGESVPDSLLESIAEAKQKFAADVWGAKTEGPPA